MKKVLLILIVGSIFTACERDESFEGPSLNDLFGEFKVLEQFAVSAAEVDFGKNQNIHFTAKFSTLSDWKITITSTSSSAKAVIEGRSKIIDASNSTWDGNISSFPSFQIGDCQAVLEIVRDSSSAQTGFKILGKRAPTGTIVADFENGIESGWNLFAQSGANMSFVVKDTGVVPHGSKYFDMGGAVNWDWLIGLIDFPATAYHADGFKLPENPTNLYFNVLIRKKPGLTNGILLFQFKEDDNEDGTFTEASEDMYSVEVKGADLTESWTIYSIRYDEIPSLVNGNPADPNGNGRHNPELLHTVSCLFLANPSSGYSQADMDFVIFTEGEPLKL